MENTLITQQELNTLSKKTLVSMYVQMNENLSALIEENRLNAQHYETILKTNEQLLKQIEDLKEQLAILTQQRF